MTVERVRTWRKPSRSFSESTSWQDFNARLTVNLSAIF